RVLAIAGYVAGCSFSPHEAGDGGIGTGSDSGVPLDACRSITDQFDTCMFGSGADLTIDDNDTYDTDTGMLVLGTGVVIKLADQRVSTPAGMIDLIAAHDFQVADTKSLTVSGTLALAIFATGTIDVAGMLDVAADGSAAGPGARASCDQGPTIGGSASSGAGGGGGGAFAGAGGNGGAGKSGATPPGGGGAVLPLPNGLLGGCAGAQGGTGGESGGLGAGGGGAILLASATSIAIEVRGGVDAGGGGGDPGHDQQAGGGGGGAGGFILLQAPTITNHGFLTANGGGGGEGANSNTPGSAGENAHTTAMAAMGGKGTNNGGNGGDGGTAMSSATDGSGTSDGGGGGGGGVGYIAVQGMLTTDGLITPFVTQWP
ncbi:MAG TPA: hypothetical protein VGG28_32320, partial [Kofleriaceae bacterium]